MPDRLIAAAEYAPRVTIAYWRGKKKAFNIKIIVILIISSTHDYVCKKCEGDFNVNETFVDRAVVHELKRVSFPCYNEKCQWEGNNVDYRVSRNSIDTSITISN